MTSIVQMALKKTFEEELSEKSQPIEDDVNGTRNEV
jgi:hypothetical protein